MRKDLLDPLEKDIEARLVKLVKRHGGAAYKFNSVNNRSVPDRVCIFSGKTFFVEVKRPGKKLTANQEIKIKEMRSLGGVVWWVSTFEEVAFLMDFYSL
jgi:Holliday junction resolvase